MWEEVDEDEEEEKEQKRNVIKGSETPTIKKKADFKTRRLKFTKKKAMGGSCDGREKKSKSVEGKNEEEENTSEILAPIPFLKLILLERTQILTKAKRFSSGGERRSNGLLFLIFI